MRITSCGYPIDKSTPFQNTGAQKTSIFQGYFGTSNTTTNSEPTDYGVKPRENSGQEKIEYAESIDDSSTLTPIVAQSIEDIKAGSHSNIRDARGYDISNINLTKEELLNLCIDKTTVMSSEQRAIIEEYKEKMKDPGLGIRALHELGITGKGVKMAIIDQPLGEHQEYSSNIVELHDINSKDIGSGWEEASMHGAAVTSIAVGKTTGVAPEATVKYFSAINLSNNPEDIAIYKSNLQKEISKCENKEHLEYLQSELKDLEESQLVTSNKPYVDAINQILDANEGLPEDERVSVISISWGFNNLASGYEELQQAIARAKEQGVFIVSTALEEHYGLNTCGANRNPQADVNNPDSYEAGAFWKEDGYSPDIDKASLLLVPMDHRTVADFKDNSSYRYEGNDGGMSWSTPWLAGSYALAKQVNPDITPEEFWEKALETSDECRNNDTGEYVGRIINPEKLIEAIQKK